MAVDSSGNIHVVDTFNHRIQKFVSAPPVNTSVTDIAAGPIQRFADLAPDAYALTETVPSRWILQNVFCNNVVSTTSIESGIEIVLNGEETTSTFYNVPVTPTALDEADEPRRLAHTYLPIFTP